MAPNRPNPSLLSGLPEHLLANLFNAATPVRLGTGDFFGELALLVAERRNADVVALGYCRLLSLAARDLSRLFGTEPALRDHIRSVAAARAAGEGG